MTEIKKASSHPDVPRPSNDDLVKLATEVCYAIEKCGASPELTNAVMLASDLRTYLQKPSRLLPHQLRVVGEKMELDTKISALKVFLESPTIKVVPMDEVNRLISQLSSMESYSSILGQRMDAF